MIEIQKINYRVVAVTVEGEQLDLTDITHALGWSEGEKELSARITMKLANVEYGGKLVSELVQPFTPIFIYAGSDSLVEVIRGTVQKWGMSETNGEMFLEIEAKDEVQALRHNMDEFFFLLKVIRRRQSSKRFLASGACHMSWCNSKTPRMRKRRIRKNILSTW